MRILHYTLVIICSFTAALFLAWKLLQPFDYGYGFFYKQLNIADHIATFAPQNRQGKTGFEHTTEEARHRLFGEICVAINNDGRGLRELNYLASANARPQILLTDAEAVHLEDVSRLVNFMMPIGWGALALWIILLIVARQAKWPLPTLGYSLMTLIIIAVLLMVIMVIIGPHEIFKAFHELVFPDDHQWFFYYQDSLMTTLMKAPDIFFAIAALWAAVATVVYLVLAAIMKIISPGPIRYHP